MPRTRRNDALTMNGGQHVAPGTERRLHYRVGVVSSCKHACAHAHFGFELSDECRLADARLAYDGHEPAIAAVCSLEPPDELSDLIHSPDEAIEIHAGGSRSRVDLVCRRHRAAAIL